MSVDNTADTYADGSHVGYTEGWLASMHTTIAADIGNSISNSVVTALETYNPQSKHSLQALKRTDMTRFDGTPKDFNRFWNQFYNFVYSNKKIDNYMKCMHLLSYIDKGTEAYRLVQHLQPQGLIDEMVRILKDRYGAHERSIKTAIESINRLRVARSIPEDQAIVTFCRTQFAELKIYGLDVNVDKTMWTWIVGSLECKLSTEMQNEWNKYCRKREEEKGILIKPIRAEDSGRNYEQLYSPNDFLDIIQAFIDTMRKGRDNRSVGDSTLTPKVFGDRKKDKPKTNDSKSKPRSKSNSKKSKKNADKIASSFVGSVDKNSQNAKASSNVAKANKRKRGKGGTASKNSKKGKTPQGATAASTSGKSKKSSHQKPFRSREEFIADKRKEDDKRFSGLKLYNTPGTCLWCGESHPSLTCNKFENMESREMWHRLRKRSESTKNKELCYRCWKENCKSGLCPEGSCGIDKCKKRHHPRLHTYYKARPPIRKR